MKKNNVLLMFVILTQKQTAFIEHFVQWLKYVEKETNLTIIVKMLLERIFDIAWIVIFVAIFMTFGFVFFFFAIFMTFGCVFFFFSFFIFCKIIIFFNINMIIFLNKINGYNFICCIYEIIITVFWKFVGIYEIWF